MVLRNKFRFYAIKICFFIFLIFLIQLFVSGFTELFLLDQTAFLQVWRLFSSIFLHGDFPHLLYNIFALALFGSILEKIVGSNKLLVVFLVTGILANIISVNFYDSSLGASGAIFGLIGALVIIRPWMIVWAFGLPMPLILAGLLWATGDVIGVFVPSNVANLAHLSGMLFGIIFGILYRKKSN